MRSGTPVESMAAAIYTAINDADILPDIEQTIRQVTQKVRPSLYDIEVVQFPQMWGSTSLGFGGMGGAAMTTAYTTVIICKSHAAVFFSGRYCYTVDNAPENEPFMKDLNKRRMASLADAEKRY